jgi:hypothetical protein
MMTIFRPIKRSSVDGSLLNSTLHRILCVTLFLFTLVLLVVHALPSFYCTFQTHQSCPVLHDHPLVPLRNIALTATSLSAGLIRRGPKLHHSPLILGTGFGLNATEAAPPGGRMIKGDPAPGDSGVLAVQPDIDNYEENVLDYANSCMISFITLGYVSTYHVSTDTRWLGSHEDLPSCRNLKCLIYLISRITFERPVQIWTLRPNLSGKTVKVVCASRKFKRRSQSGYC